jgi:antirestriction protein ArdC
MSRSAACARTGHDRTSLYSEITDKIIAELEAGRVPWVQTWGTSAAKASLAMPKNAATQRRYSGVNVLILWGAVIERGFAGQRWLTFRQASSLGGNVRIGEHGTTVVYADRFIPDEERKRAERDGDEPGVIPFLKRFTVFNTAQCENLPSELVNAPPPVPEGLILPQAEALIAATGADFRIGGDRAFYSPTQDYVQVPRPDAYFEPVNWHRTALHELGHWVGHPSRLARDLSGMFGSALYAKEELVAEMTSASCAPRSASCRRCATPIISVPGSRCSARTTAPSCGRRVPPPRRQTTCSPSVPNPENLMLPLRSTSGGRPDLLPPRGSAFVSRARASPRGRGPTGFRDG